MKKIVSLQRLDTHKDVQVALTTLERALNGLSIPETNGTGTTTVEPGPKGDTGPKGDPGTAGVDGVDGAAGPAGPTILGGIDGDVQYNDAGVLGGRRIDLFGFWSPLTNGDPVTPELIFDSLGDTIAVWTPT